jgi:hypothetical protein
MQLKKCWAYEMPSSKKGSNTLCVVSFLIVLLGIGLYCVFKPPPLQEPIQLASEEQIRTSIEDSSPQTNNRRGLPSPEDNIELIGT